MDVSSSQAAAARPASLFLLDGGPMAGQMQRVLERLAIAEIRKTEAALRQPIQQEKRRFLTEGVAPLRALEAAAAKSGADHQRSAKETERLRVAAFHDEQALRQFELGQHGALQVFDARLREHRDPLLSQMGEDVEYLLHLQRAGTVNLPPERLELVRRTRAQIRELEVSCDPDIDGPLEAFRSTIAQELALLVPLRAGEEPPR